MTQIRMPDGHHLAYVLHHEAWYGSARHISETPHMTVAAVQDSDGDFCAWDLTITQEQGRIGVDPDKADMRRADVKAVLAALSDGGAKTLAEAVEILGRLGAADETQR